MQPDPGHPSAAPPRAAPPHGSSAHTAGAQEVIFEGRCKHSAVLGGYLKGLLVCIVGGAAAYGLSYVPDLQGWPLWVLSLTGLPLLLLVYLRHRTTRYKITRRRVEFERGILSKRVDSLELWRVLDVSYAQSLADRVLGNATLVLMGTDRSSPALSIHGLPHPRRVFEALRDAVQDARQLNRPYEFQTHEAGS